MAKAVEFGGFTPSDSRDDLIRRVKQAPVEHAEAMLASYDLLQRLYDKGVIDFFNGLLSARDTVIERVTDVVASKEAVAAFRMSLRLGILLTSIDPDNLNRVISEAEGYGPPSLFSLVRQATTRDTRRGMSVAIGLLNVLGAALNAQRLKR